MGVYKLSATSHIGKRKGPGRKERENCRLSWRDALGTSSHTKLVSPRIAALLSPSPRGRLLRLAEGGDVAGGGAPVQAARSSSAGRMWEQVEARPVRELAADVGGLRPGEAGGELVAAAWSATCAGVARLTHKSSPCGQLHLGGGGEVGGGARHRHGRPSPGMGGEADGRVPHGGAHRRRGAHCARVARPAGEAAVGEAADLGGRAPRGLGHSGLVGRMKMEKGGG
jgi:hypothetical protein